eukprot:UN02988
MQSPQSFGSLYPPESPPLTEQQVQFCQQQFNLNQHELAVITHVSYNTAYLQRDLNTLMWLRENLEGWIEAFLAILIMPHPNPFRGLDQDDLMSIFQKIAPPTNIDELAALFGGMSL